MQKIIIGFSLIATFIFLISSENNLTENKIQNCINMKNKTDSIFFVSYSIEMNQDKLYRNIQEQKFIKSNYTKI